MSKVEKTLERILRGNADANIRFGDLCALLSHLGFAERVRGDHPIFTRDGVVEILNLQPFGGKAKAYQVRQVRGVLTSYGLAGAPEAEEAATEEASHEEAGPTATEEKDGEQHQV
ncbi:MAG: type II toxin-antitoxin system HicA family toxin [Gemmataceae bacterium]